jgi:hypothetical protein
MLIYNESKDLGSDIIRLEELTGLTPVARFFNSIPGDGL